MSAITSSGVLRQREPRVRNKAYLGFVAQCPCLPCAVRGITRRPVQVCHIRMGVPDAGWREFGRSEKPHDFRTFPGCPTCHLYGPGAQHRTSERDWWAALGIEAPAFCAALYAAFEAGENGAEVVHKFAAAGRAKLAQRRVSGNP